jgi:hypothetical protein
MTESLHLYMNSSTCLLRRQSGWPWKRTVAAFGHGSWHAHDPASLDLVLPGGGVRRGTALHVVLGASLCKFLVVDIPAEVVDPVERAVVAVARMRQHFALAPEDWDCTADARIGNSQATACAVRAALVKRLRVLAATHGLKLASVRPYASVLWDVVCAQRTDGAETGLLAVEDDAFTVIMARSGRVVALHALQQHGAAGLAERELRRIGLSAGPAMREAMWLAMPARLADGAEVDPARFLRSRDNWPGGMAADFQDLLIDAGGKA